jgi:hypothetical protein
MPRDFHQSIRKRSKGVNVFARSSAEMSEFDRALIDIALGLMAMKAATIDDRGKRKGYARETARRNRPRSARRARLPLHCRSHGGDGRICRLGAT